MLGTSCKIGENDIPHGIFGSLRKLCQKGCLIEALHFVDLINQQGFPLCTRIFFPLLQVCISKKDLQADANKVFSKLPRPDVFTWSAIISAHAKLGQGERAVELYLMMQQQASVKADAHTFVAVLAACSRIAAIDQGKLVHTDIIELGLDLVLQVANTLIDMYAKYGNLEDALTVFDKVLDRDVVTWNAIISGYSHHGQGQKAFQLFQQMQEKGTEPDDVTFICILKSCYGLADPDGAKFTFSHINFEIGDCVRTDTNNCAKGFSLEDARKLFDRLSNRSLATWSAMIALYAEHGHTDESLQLFKRMQQEGLKPDSVTFVCILKSCLSSPFLDRGKLIHAYIIESGHELDLYVGNSLIDMYAKYGSLQNARRLFDKLSKWSVVTWSAMIAGYAQHDHGQDALELFQRMQHEGMEPNDITYFCVLKACSNIAALDQGKLIHAHIIGSGSESDLHVGNTLIDMYVKCGSLYDAHTVFFKMPKRTVVTWSAMIAGYAHQNNYDLILQGLKDMQQEGLNPNGITFLCLLSACCHLGLVSEGWCHFLSMVEVYAIVPTREHYNCMSDLLGRAGCLKEAADLLQGMPGGSNVVAWMSLLSQCRTHGNLQLAKRCFSNIVRLDARDASGYVLMSNIYADTGLLEYADQVQVLRKHASLVKKLGTACIEVDNIVHNFVAGDRSHPDSDHLYSKLKRLDFEFKEEGHVPQLVLVLQSLLDE